MEHVRCAFVACVLLFSSLFGTAVFANDDGLAFVASDEELSIAIHESENETIRGLAIKQDFYLGSTNKTKEQIRALIVRVHQLRFRPIYVYGANLSDVLGMALVGGRVGNCIPSVFVGIAHRTGQIKNAVLVCGADNSNPNEDRIRDQIRNNARDVHAMLRRK